MHFSETIPQFKEKFYQLVEDANQIIITGHQPIDDDSIASVLSLYHILKEDYPRKEIRMIQEGQGSDNLKIFSGYENVNFVDDLTEEVDDGDLLIMVDGCEWGRFTDRPEKLKTKVKKSICIDHHDSPPDEFDLSIIIPTAPSAVEIIYWLLIDEREIEKPLAEIILLGILGDTGNFQYLIPENVRTFDIIKRLLPVVGVNIEKFQSRYRKITKTDFDILSQLIKNTRFHEIKNWPKFQTCFLNRDFVKKNNLTENEIRNGYHFYMDQYLRTIEGYEWGIIISALEEKFTISLRSLPGSVSVRRIVEELSVGGGHDRAAGGSFDFDKYPTIETCFQEIFNHFKTNQPTLV